MELIQIDSVGVIATAAVYALFKFGLRVRLPQGILFK